MAQCLSAFCSFRELELSSQLPATPGIGGPFQASMGTCIHMYVHTDTVRQKHTHTHTNTHKEMKIDKSHLRSAGTHAEQCWVVLVLGECGHTNLGSARKSLP